jgi:hypothetical protein
LFKRTLLETNIQKMEKHITQKLEKFQIQFKTDIKEWLTSHNATVSDSKHPTNNLDSEFLKFVYDYNSMTMNETDFKKRKRIKNIVPQFELCIAKRANDEQCTRRKKTDGKYKDEVTHFCGTHVKGTPHGIVTNDVTIPKPNNKIEVWVKDIKGINYYIDSQNNVYNPEDILANKVNPAIIAKWTKTADEVYSIPQFGI